MGKVGLGGGQTEVRPRRGGEGQNGGSSPRPEARLASRSRLLAIALVGGCILAAALSLLAPWSLVYDPWAWLVWGRELASLELDTTGGPSWKPLPVAVTALASAAGDAAPSLWLIVARAGWLLAASLAAILAARLVWRAAPAASAGHSERIASLAAALIAAVGVVLLSDEFTPWLRQFAGGLSEPLLVALVLASVERGLAGRDHAAFALAVAAALLRPEVWPFLGAYAIWVWRREAMSAPVLLGAAALVLVAWFLPDLLGSGSPFTGAERARGGTGSAAAKTIEALGRVGAMPLAVLWIGVAIALWDGLRRSDRTIPLLAGGALAWIVLVAAMAGAGWAGLPRFAAPAAAMVCVLGAVGISRLIGSGRVAAVGLTALVLLGLAQGVPRGAALGDHAAHATALAAHQDALPKTITAAGKSDIVACRPLTVARLEEHTAAAWWLGVSLAEMRVSDRRPAEGLYLEWQPTGWRAHTHRCAAGARGSG